MPKSPETGSSNPIEVEIKDDFGQKFEDESLRDVLINRGRGIADEVSKLVSLKPNEKIQWLFKLFAPWSQQKAGDRVERLREECQENSRSEIFERAQKIMDENKGREGGAEQPSFMKIVEKVLDMKAEEELKKIPERQGFLYIEASLVDKNTGRRLGPVATNTRIFPETYVTKQEGEVDKDKFIKIIVGMLENRKI